jgi:peptidoglycan/LPS O-acetylase OafA/YrhL
MKLSVDLSAYLDFLRFVAALAVLLGHMDQDGIAIGWLGLTYFSHEAVIVFFVLSGFIIRHSTFAKASTARAYAVARLSRVYSVALPAVLACSALAWIVHAIGLDEVTSHPSFRAFAAQDIASSLLFLNESWSNSSNLSLNPPFWSLCYEVWFYVLFGVFTFARGSWRWPLMALVALVAGPAVLVLLPVWLMGAWMAARVDWSKTWSSGFAWAGFLLPLVLMVTINVTEFDLALRGWLKDQIAPMWRLGSSQRFATDYLLGLLMVLHIRSFPSLPFGVRQWFVRWQRVLAGLAGFSFTLYLFHRPLTVLLGMYAPSQPGAVVYPLAVTVTILLICWGISFGTERQLPRWRGVLSKCLAHTRKAN